MSGHRGGRQGSNPWLAGGAVRRGHGGRTGWAGCRRLACSGSAADPPSPTRMFRCVDERQPCGLHRLRCREPCRLIGDFAPVDAIAVPPEHRICLARGLDDRTVRDQADLREGSFHDTQSTRWSCFHCPRSESCTRVDSTTIAAHASICWPRAHCRFCTRAVRNPPIATPSSADTLEMIAGHSTVDVGDLHPGCLLSIQRDHATGPAQDACRPSLRYSAGTTSTCSPGSGVNHRPSHRAAGGSRHDSTSGTHHQPTDPCSCGSWPSRFERPAARRGYCPARSRQSSRRRRFSE